MRIRPKTLIALVLVTFSMVPAWLIAADWPMFGRDNTRNAVSTEKNPPTFWRVVDTTDIKRVLLPRDQFSRNIKWTAQLGSNTAGDPVVANGHVWIGTNNSPLDKLKERQDASVLMCFRETDGKLLYVYQ